MVAGVYRDVQLWYRPGHFLGILLASSPSMQPALKVESMAKVVCFWAGWISLLRAMWGGCRCRLVRDVVLGNLMKAAGFQLSAGGGSGPGGAAEAGQGQPVGPHQASVGLRQWRG